MSSCQKYFDNNYNALGSYIKPSKIPIVSAVNSGSMVVPVFAGYTAQDYSNPDYNVLMGRSGNNYDSVSQAYMKNCPRGNCVRYEKVKNSCNSVPPSVRIDENSRI